MILHDLAQRKNIAHRVLKLTGDRLRDQIAIIIQNILRRFAKGLVKTFKMEGKCQPFVSTSQQIAGLWPRLTEMAIRASSKTKQWRCAMNVPLTPELEQLVQIKVQSGRYNSASEVVREALRLMEQRMRSARFNCRSFADEWIRDLPRSSAAKVLMARYSCRG